MTQIINIDAYKIKEFFNNDKVCLKDLPIENAVRNIHKTIDFTTIENEISRQEFRDLLYLIYSQDKPYKKTSDVIYHVLRLAGFMSNLDGITKIPDDKLREMFHLYCEKNKFGADNKKIILTCKHALLDFYDTRKGFERDVWDDSIYRLPAERVNKSACRYAFNFRKIEFVHNRELVKKYFLSLIGQSELAESTITNAFSMIVQFCQYLDTKKLEDVTSEDFTDYLSENQDLGNSAYKHKLNRINSMYDYLKVKYTNSFKNANPVQSSMYRKEKVKYITNLVDEYTILQIFGHLDSAPFDYMLIYLINYCTGMRISDVCQLRTDCLFEDGDNGYYIKPYICQKMQKPIMNLIPKALYELIQKRIKEINNLEYDEVYLFPSDKEKLRPYVAQTYRNNFKKLCKEWGIKNEDGSDYNYVTHAYRHTLATELHIRYQVPQVTIQKAVLWHQEIQMSYHYIEKNIDFRKMNADKYFSKIGEGGLNEYLKGNLKSHILPNGICSKSTKLTTCPVVDACLSCTYFKTSKQFLSVHKEQLAILKTRLPIYEANGWTPNLVTTKRQIQELEDLITRLETQEDSDGNKEITTSISTTTI